MLPEKRRRGRAIRKQRREMREAAEGFTAAVNALQAALLPAFGAAARLISEAFANLATFLATPPRRNQYAPLPPGIARGLSGPGTGDPSQLGVGALRSPHSASRGHDAYLAIYDEPLSFGEEYDDAAEADKGDGPATNPRG